MIQSRKAKYLSTSLLPWYPAALNVPASKHNEKCTPGFSGLILFALSLILYSEFPAVHSLLSSRSSHF